jgi:hypothetical protein
MSALEAQLPPSHICASMDPCRNVLSDPPLKGIGLGDRTDRHFLYVYKGQFACVPSAIYLCMSLLLLVDEAQVINYI